MSRWFDPDDSCGCPMVGSWHQHANVAPRRSWREAYRQKHLICPTCKRPTLTPWEKARGYQCRDCTQNDET